METIDTNVSQNNTGISELSKTFILEAAKWAKFLSIVGFVMLGLGTLGGIVMIAGGAMVSSMSPFGGVQAAGGVAFMGIVYLGVMLLYFFPTLYLFKFATKIKMGILNNDGVETDNGFENLKSMFKFMGILMIIVLSIYALMFVFMIIAAATAASM